MKMRTRKAFTLLELTVAIVVLGILAALAIPTFAAVISGARGNTAIASAMSVSRDAVAIAAQSNLAVSSGNLTTAAGEASGVTVSSNIGAAGSGGVAKFAVVTAGGNSVNVCVTEPTAVNGTPVAVTFGASGC